MELTPLKIRGKRRRKGEPAPVIVPVVTAQKTQTQTMSKQPRERKRPRIRASYLEKKLPLEVVERILWMCENVNMLRASPRLGWLLSGEYSRHEALFRAFGPTWDARGQDDQKSVGNPDFQSALLEYNWVSITFILECWDLWLRRHVKNGGNQHPCLEHLQNWLQTSTSSPHPDDEQSRVGLVSAKQIFTQEYSAFCTKLEGWAPGASPHLGEICVHECTQIPEKLLIGPWDEAATQKLFWLCRAEADMTETQSWELTVEGFHNALAGNVNRPAIQLLLSTGGWQWPEDAAMSEYREIQRRRDSGTLDAEVARQVAYALFQWCPSLRKKLNADGESFDAFELGTET